MSESGLDDRGLPDGYPFNEEWEITPRETREMVSEPDRCLLLDCRRDDEVATAKIEGAVHIPMEEIGARADEIEDWEEKPVVVYCHTGRRSLRVATLLKQMGFEDVRSMAGGIELWSLDIDPSIPRY